MTMQATFPNFLWSSLWDIRVPPLQAGGQTSLLQCLGSGWELPLTESQIPLGHAGLCLLFQKGWKAVPGIHSSALVTSLQSRPFPLRSPSTVEYPPVAFCQSRGSQDQATWHQLCKLHLTNSKLYCISHLTPNTDIWFQELQIIWDITQGLLQLLATSCV